MNSAPVPIVDLGRSAPEVQVTHSPTGHMLANTGVWSPDSAWVVYDVRTDETQFTGKRIERVHVETGKVAVLHRSTNGACCGVPTYSPVRDQVVFILGPEPVDGQSQYAATNRRGVLVDTARPGALRNLDARDVTAPFTPGALRGGTHVHVFSGDGRWVSSTYEDQVLAERPADGGDADPSQRNVAVSVPGAVHVEQAGPGSNDGEFFTVLVTRTVAKPTPGGDEISRAFEDAWVGENGYLRPDGTRQPKAIAFQGNVMTSAGETISEVFLVDLPADLTRPGDGPLEGTETRRPAVPRGVVQRRLTLTEDRLYPGLQGPRHWLRSSPDGSRIAFYRRDDAGVVQLWTVSPNGGDPVQVTRNAHDAQSAFSWSPDGRRIAYAMDNSVCATDVSDGRTYRLTARAADASAPTHHACVFSPDGRHIAYMRPVALAEGTFDQVFVVTLPEDTAG